MLSLQVRAPLIHESLIVDWGTYQGAGVLEFDKKWRARPFKQPPQHWRRVRTNVGGSIDRLVLVCAWFKPEHSRLGGLYLRTYASSTAGIWGCGSGSHVKKWLAAVLITSSSFANQERE